MHEAMKISVIVPFYNLEAYARDTLESIARAVRILADYSDQWGIELILVDDGSTDRTGQLLDAFKSEGISTNCESHILHIANSGQGSARNAGLSLATGDWITYLDGDDLWRPEYLVRFAEVLTKTKSDIVTFRHKVFKDGETPLHQDNLAQTKKNIIDVENAIPGSLIMDLGIFPTCFRRNVVGRVNFSTLSLAEDRLYIAECLSVARSVTVIDQIIYAYRVRPNSMAHRSWSPQKIASLSHYAAQSLTIFNGSGKRVEPGGLKYLASMLLSEIPTRIWRLKNRADRQQACKSWLQDITDVCQLKQLTLPMFYRWCALSCHGLNRTPLLLLCFARLLRKLSICRYRYNGYYATT